MKRAATKRVRPNRKMTILFKPLTAHRELESKLAGYGLSKRQQEVAGWVIRGLSNRQIAERLFITEQTVKDHLHDIFEMMKIRRRSELAARILGYAPNA